MFIIGRTFKQFTEYLSQHGDRLIKTIEAGQYNPTVASVTSSEAVGAKFVLTRGGW